MKKLYTIFIILLMTNVLYASSSNPIFTTQEIDYITTNNNVSVAMLEKFKPFSYVEKRIHQGMTKDILNIISSKSGLKFDVKLDSWSNNIKKFKNNEVDIITAISYKKSRENFTLFTDPYYDIGVYLFKNKNDVSINSFKDLKDKKVGINKGIFYKDQLEKLGITVVEFENVDNRTQALAFGEIDCFLSSFTSGMNSIVKLALTNIKPAFEINDIKKEDLRFGINKKKNILQSIMSKTLASIDKLTFKKLEKKWIIALPPTKQVRIKLTISEQKWIKEHKTIKVHNEKGWIPFNFYDKEPLGYSIDYMNLMANKLGIKIEYITGPSWNEFMGMIEKNELDVMLNIVKTEERSKYLNFTDPYKISSDRIYAVTDHNIKSLEDLAGKTIAIEKGFSHEENLKKYYPKIKMKYFNNIEHRLKAVSFGQADATIATPEVAQEMLKRHLISNVVAKSEANFTNETLNNLKLRIATNKQNITLYNLLNKAMRSISYEEKNKLDTKWFYSDLNKIEQKITKVEKVYINNNIFKIATTSSWSPFNFSDNKKLVGIGVDYLNIIKNKLDLKSEIIIKDTFTDVINSIKNKNADITFTTTNTKDREKYALFSNPYEKFPIAIASTKDRKFIPNGSLLEGKKVAVGKGYGAYFLLKEKYPHIDFVFTKDTKEALELVMQKKVYAAVDILPVLQYNINNHFENKLKISGTTNVFFEMKLMIHKKHIQLLSPINKAIDSINNDQKNAIYRKWLLTPKKGMDSDLFYNILSFLIVLFIIGLLWSLHILKSKKLIVKEKRKLDGILASIPVPILITEVSTRKIVFANDYASTQYGIPLEKLIGESIDIIYIDTTVKDLILKAMDENGKLINFETKYRVGKNRTIDALLSFVPLNYNDKDCRLGVISNITKLKETQAELEYLNFTLEDRVKSELEKNAKQQFVMFQQSRHAQMGEMISMIAHQWRQPLNILSLLLTTILFKYNRNKLDGDILKELTDKSNEQIQNMSETIDDFRNFFKPDKVAKEFELNKEISKTLNMLSPILEKSDIKVNLEIEDNICIIGYQNEFSQAIINIINNAKDTLIEKEIENKKIDILLYKTSKQIILEIKDNAGGIPEDIINDIFMPYFSTKSEKTGTGLGLHMSKLIIEEHMSGELQVKNDNNGANFIISFNKL